MVAICTSRFGLAFSRSTETGSIEKTRSASPLSAIRARVSPWPTGKIIHLGNTGLTAPPGAGTFQFQPRRWREGLHLVGTGANDLRDLARGCRSQDGARMIVV